jgi:hypothetical protein
MIGPPVKTVSLAVLIRRMKSSSCSSEDSTWTVKERSSAVSPAAIGTIVSSASVPSATRVSVMRASRSGTIPDCWLAKFGRKATAPGTDPPGPVA